MKCKKCGYEHPDKCPECKGNMEKGKTTVGTDRSQHTQMKCTECGRRFVEIKKVEQLKAV